MPVPVHMIGDAPSALKMETDAKTRCGLIGVTSAREQPYYHLINAQGGTFKATTRSDLVTCLKCKNLLAFGTIHGRKSA